MDTGFGSEKPDLAKSPTGLVAHIFTYYLFYLSILFLDAKL